jgi:hypothetical protein
LNDLITVVLFRLTPPLVTATAANASIFDAEYGAGGHVHLLNSKEIASIVNSIPQSRTPRIFDDDASSSSTDHSSALEYNDDVD